MKIIDLTNNKYGRLTVLCLDSKKLVAKNSHRYFWKCICSCGNDCIVSGNNLRNGTTTSCGCYHKERQKKARFIDLTGQKYGKLEVIKHEGYNKGHSMWLCNCECGNQNIVSGYYLRKGKTKSCGCGQGRFTHGKSTKPGYKKWMRDENPSRKLRHNISCLIRISLQANNGSKKGESIFKYLPYAIQDLKNHLEKQFEPWMSWENYGGLPDSEKRTWWLDHIIPQNNFNYTLMTDKAFQECWALSNLRPLEKHENMSKGTKKWN